MEEIFSAESGRNKLSVYYDRDEQEYLFEIENSCELPTHAKGDGWASWVKAPSNEGNVP